MKKILIHLFVVMAINSQAYAIHLSQDTKGEFLMSPYYTTQENMVTLSSITNHDMESIKAVKYIFRDALNGQAMLIGNVYLKPMQTWTFALAGVEDKALMLSNNESICEVPKLNQFPVHFRTFNFENDTGTNDQSRAREGFFEVIEMGSLSAALSCDEITNRWLGGSGTNWNEQPLVDVEKGDGEISMEVNLINVDNGQSISIPPIVLNNVFDTPAHYYPGDVGRTLKDTSPAESTVYLDRQWKSLQWQTGLEAAESVLMVNKLVHPFMIESIVDARNDAIIFYPTKHLHTQEQFQTGLEPFSSSFDGSECEQITNVIVDRSGEQSLNESVTQCNQINVLALSENSAVSTASAQYIEPGVESGQSQFIFNQHHSDLRSIQAIDGTVLTGLPAWVTPVMSVFATTSEDPNLGQNYMYTNSVVRTQ